MESSSPAQKFAAEHRDENDDIRDKVIKQSHAISVGGIEQERALRTEASILVIQAAQRAGMKKNALETLVELGERAG